MEDGKQSLALRIAMPVVLLVLALGLSLYIFVLTAISEFTEDQIEGDLRALSRRIYNICNLAFEDMVKTGRVDDRLALVVHQALTLGEIEDFLREENLKGLVYSDAEQEVILQKDLPMKADRLIESTGQHGMLIPLEAHARGYYAYRIDFTPWRWHVFIIKSRRAYADLTEKVQRIHVYTLGLLTAATFLLVFFIYRTVKQPINAIIQPLKSNQSPRYRGIDVFEYLSDTIALMMQSLRQSQEKYRSLVETTIDLVWEVDRTWTFTYLSPAVELILGYGPGDLLGRTLFDLMPDDELKEARRRFEQIASQRMPFKRLERVLLHKSGRRITLETSGVPILNEDDGRLTGYRGIDRDVTERVIAEVEHKVLEARLQQLQKLEAIGTLAGGIAHDFNNILSIVLGYIVLAGEDAASEEMQGYLAEAEKACERAKALTNQLITFSRGGAPIKKAGSVRKTLVDAVEEALTAAAVSVDFSLADDLWSVDFDAVQLHQAIRNLIDNAVEAMPCGGSLRISADNRVAQSRLSNSPLLPEGKKYVTITIQDNGHGIPEDHLALIFDPYFSTKLKGTQKGMGMGLSISHSIISRHDGSMAVTSEPGIGTTITIDLPVHEEKAGAQPRKPARIGERGRPTSRTILLMDDEEMIRQLAGAMLERIGYRTRFAIEGAEAVRLYQEALDDGRPFDFVILDLTVKGGMGGKEAAKKILEIDPYARTIVSSGYSNDPVMTHYRSYGFVGVLPKPYHKDDLEALLENRKKKQRGAATGSIGIHR